ncbi:hypothetical protein H6768_04250 [Candidatus Peribacteria bacterium]|nr:hypothetical protein [Candidatus Peribacteria bacterium]
MIDFAIRSRCLIRISSLFSETTGTTPMSSSRKGVAVGVLEDTRYHVIATPINKNTEKMIIIFLRESHPIITARITTLQKDAKPLLSFFYWNIVW